MKIIFLPIGIIGKANIGETIAEAAAHSGVYIEACCGSKRSCGKCRVKLLSGSFGDNIVHASVQNVSPVTAAERKLLSQAELEDNYRLACAAEITGDAAVEVPVRSKVSGEVILKQGMEKEIECNPAVRAYYLELPKATLEDNRDNFTRVKEELACRYQELNGELEIDFALLKKLPEIIRAGDWKLFITILLNKKKIIQAEPHQTHKQLYGVAFDVGTTTIAAYLCELENGRTKQTASMMNPQIGYGDDVLSRISYCVEHENGVEKLQGLLLEGLNTLIRQMADRERIEAGQIAEAVLVFNTVMEHIALGINPRFLGIAPFIPAAAEALDITARSLGLEILPGGNIHCLPSEAGFIGADNAAVLISEEPYLQDKIKLIIDIGTNSELCLGNRDGLYITSCATGPAFEGAQIQCGIRACEGAIERVSVDPVTLEPALGIIGSQWKGDSAPINSTPGGSAPIDSVPVGICGSGIIDAVAQMAEAGILEPDGKFTKKLASERIRTGQDGRKEYVLYFKRNDDEKDIVITQKDVRAVQLAKAALYAGAKALMSSCGIKEIDEIILAGAFGNYIDKENALKLGLFPDCRLDCVRVVGNAAGLGARMALVNIDKRREAGEIARQVKFIETAVKPEYQRIFAKAMAIPHEEDCFSKNQPYLWPCMGMDTREASKEALELGEDLLRDTDAMDRIVTARQREEKKSYLQLPVLQKIEAVAYGGKPRVAGSSIVVDYLYQKPEQLHLNNSLINNAAIRNTLECISRHSGEKILLEVEGPFSVLAALVDPVKLYAYCRKNKTFLTELLMRIADDLAGYTIEALKRGVGVISFADPEGVTELVGEVFYREVSGAAAAAYLRRLEGCLEGALVHLCGKTSYSLQRAGYITAKTYRAEDKPYTELLFDYSKNRKFKYVGHGCIHAEKLPAPIIHKLELANAAFPIGVNT